MSENMAPNGGARSIEETYQKKSQIEHILIRPDTYGECARPHPTNNVHALPGRAL